MIKKSILLILTFSIIATSAFAQDLDSLLEAELNKKEEIEIIEATFKATRIVLGHSIENSAKGELNFLISHHFGTLNQGAYNLWGLDQSSIRFGFDYGITKKLSVGIGRSSLNKIYDGYVKLKLFRQSTGKKTVPLSISAFSNIGITSLDWPNPERDNLFESRLSYTFQLLMARKFSSRLSVQLTPTMIHRNLVNTKEDENDVFSIGAGGRLKLTNRFSINAEYFYLLPGKTADDYYDSFSVGFDIETGGHIFQIYITNSNGMIEQEFIPITNGNWNKGDIRLGFNISRVFTILKNKTVNLNSDY
jgi:opacity protein-like surface antigen